MPKIDLHRLTTGGGGGGALSADSSNKHKSPNCLLNPNNKYTSIIEEEKAISHSDQSSNSPYSKHKDLNSNDFSISSSSLHHLHPTNTKNHNSQRSAAHSHSHSHSHCHLDNSDAKRENINKWDNMNKELNKQMNKQMNNYVYESEDRSKELSMARDNNEGQKLMGFKRLQVIREQNKRKSFRNKLKGRFCIVFPDDSFKPFWDSAIML
jgi:hypothetical protein